MVEVTSEDARFDTGRVRVLPDVFCQFLDPLRKRLIQGSPIMKNSFHALLWEIFLIESESDFLREILFFLSREDIRRR